MPSKQRSSSGSGGTSPPSYNAATNSKEKGDRRRQQFERQISAGQIRLRSGSAGHRPLKNEEPDMDEEHEPIEFSAKPQIVVDPRDIRIVETTPGGARRSMTGPHLAEEEYWDEDGGREGGQQGVASIGEDGAIDMTGVGEFQDDERGGWGNKLDFLFSCISVSVGLGNVWRFPYLCYKNGGGTFLLIYFIAMFGCGIPIFFQEVATGQYLGSGGLTMIGQLVPMLQGVGYATMTIVFFLDIYYCIIICWTLFYLINSFVAIPDLPWGSCGNWWNTPNCYDSEHLNTTDVTNQVLDGQTTPAIHENIKHNNSKSPVEEYWDQRVLGITKGMEDLGGMQWELFGTLVLGWIIVYLIIWKGLHSSGKIIWFTALFPYFVMSVLLVRSVTLPGASIGLWKYITPDWDKLYNSETWIDSATQIFFAYSIGTGALPALGSYNKFHHNCIGDAIITCFVNTGTCLFAGCVTFSILGHMAYNQDVPIEKVVNSGPGLVFITYPEVVLKLPGGPIWAVTFFLMLVTIGIDSEFCIVESLVTGIVDMWPEYLRPRRRKFTAALCFLLFILGVPMTTQGGAYIFQLMDFYSASGIPILWCCFFQTIGIGWIYGASKFANCVEQMTGYKPHAYWWWTWAVIAPGTMFVIFWFYVVKWVPVKYGEVEYPMYAHVIGAVMSLASMLWIPGYAIYYIATQRGSLRDRVIKGITPDIKSARVKAPPKKMKQNLSGPDLMMSESSARLLKNPSSATFMTNMTSNPSSFNVNP